MFGSHKRRLRNKNLELYRDITDDVEESDFVPYACFYDENTVITKNGELCQTIKVTGLNRDSIGEDDEEQELRGLIRDSLKRHVPNDSFAIWLHTLRKETDLSSSGDFPDGGFAKEVNDLWIEENGFANQFVNEVYITIVHEGQDVRLREFKNFLVGLIPSKDLSWRNEYIDGIFSTLNNTVENILNDLKHFGVNRLGMHQENGIYYSEQLRFLEKIINFVDRPMPAVEIDLSTYLTTGEITFAFNAMEVRTAGGKRRFASILTLKEYKEASLPVIDQFLQLPMEFIVTQTVNFVNPQKVLFEYQEMANYQRLSEDPDITRISELSNILDSNRNNPNDFGEQQLTIFILSDTVKMLEQNVKRTISFFSKFGMIAVREDIKFQEAYWAQLPGNFIFVNRMKQTNTSHVAGFTNLSNMPMGADKNNHWGAAVSTFHTATGTPYYFNFHVGEVGHTTVVGPKDSGKSVMINFLLSQSMKFSPKMYYFDVDGSSTSMMTELGGTAYMIAAHQEGMQPQPALFNPFSLKNTDDNIQFITRWMGVLARASGYALTDTDKQMIANAAHQTFQQTGGHRSLLGCVELLKHSAPDYVAALAAWLPGGQYGHIFTAEQSVFARGTQLLSLNMQYVMQDPALGATAISFLVQKVLDELNGEPTILVMEEAWQLLGQTHLGGNIPAMLDFLTERNAILVSIAEELEHANSTPVAQALAYGSPTQVYMPDEDPHDNYQNVYGLEDLEFSYLDIMEKSARHFLLKHGSETVIGEMNLAGLEHYFDVLTGRRAEHAA